MTAEDISRAQGLRVSSNQLDAVKQCLELHASGYASNGGDLMGGRWSFIDFDITAGAVLQGLQAPAVFEWHAISCQPAGAL